MGLQEANKLLVREGVVDRKRGFSQINDFSQEIVNEFKAAKCGINSEGQKLFKQIINGKLSAKLLKKSKPKDILVMLDLIVGSILNMPIMFKKYRHQLVKALENKVMESRVLQQRLKIYLYNHYSNSNISELFGDCEFKPKMRVINETESIKEYKYLDTDIISFLNEIQYHHIKTDLVLKMDHLNEYDIWGTDKKINHIQIIKENKDKSNVLAAYDVNNYEISKFILRNSNNNYSRYSQIMHFFRYINTIWSENNINYCSYPIRNYIYNILSIGNDICCYEYIPDCVSLRKINKIKKSINIYNLIPTLIGGCISSLIIGTNQKHFDSIFIDNEGCMFFTDFNCFMTNESRMVLNNDLFKIIHEYIDEIIKIGIECFMILRSNIDKLTNFANIAFIDIENIDIKTELHRILQTKLDNNTAHQNIKKTLLHTFKPKRGSLKQLFTF